MTAQTMSFRYEFACNDHSTEKAQDLVTQQNDLCCFIDLTFTLHLKLKFFFTVIYAVFLESKLQHEYSVFNKQHIYEVYGAINVVFTTNLSYY